MCVDNPMCDPDAIERHYREAEEFDEELLRCGYCQRDVGPTEMDMELSGVCGRCVAEALKSARQILENQMGRAQYELYRRVIETYTEGVL